MGQFDNHLHLNHQSLSNVPTKTRMKVMILSFSYCVNLGLVWYGMAVGTLHSDHTKFVPPLAVDLLLVLLHVP